MVKQSRKMLQRNMALLLLCFTPIFADQDLDLFSKFFQRDYDIKNERITNDGFNKELLQDFSMAYYKYNRTTRALNLTILSHVDLNRDKLNGLCHTYKRYGNEFKTFPIRFSFKLCRALEENMLGTGTFNCGKLQCPIKKNVRQSFCNWRPDYSRMPPFIPDGEYIFKINLTYGNQYLYNMEYLATVYRKVKMIN